MILVGWFLGCAQARTTGTYDAVGPVISFGSWIEQRSGQAAVATGLRHRPRADLQADALEWEREQGLDRPRPAGLTAGRERELLAALGAA